jgi:phosphopantothenoylcysteine decarboxylase/phosphopantothenate--cysteine ligase
MHTEMWEHAAVQENLEVLRRRGVYIVEPASGRLAGGDVGMGRLAEPSDIVAAAVRIVSEARPLDLAGRRVLVTAGGTREPIDPVRFIANRSSGKQGYALAEAARARGAIVTLVTTVQLPAPAGAEVVNVDTAAEMADAVLSRAADQDLIVMAAAVADFRPSTEAPTKIRKASGPPELVLEPTLDVLAALGSRRRNGQVLVGFAAETESVVERSMQKLASKGVDLVVGNDVAADGVGFSHDTNAVTIVSADGRTDIPLTSKRVVADAVLDAAVARLQAAPVRGHGQS